MIISVFLDESGTHNDTPIMTVGGVVGRLGQWATFDAKWRRLLKRHQIDFVHTKKFNQGTGQFKGWNREKKLAFIREMNKVAANVLFGFAIILRKEDFSKYYAHKPRPRKHQLDSMYGICVRLAIGQSLFYTKQFLESNDLQVSYILEKGHKNACDANRIFNRMKNSPFPFHEDRKLLGSISFDGKRIPGLQLADGIAHSSYSFEYNLPALVQEQIIYIKNPSSSKETKDNIRAGSLREGFVVNPKQIKGEYIRRSGNYLPVLRYEADPDVLKALRYTVDNYGQLLKEAQDNATS